jgi:putative hemolysin
MAKNVWIEFLAKYRKANPGVSMKMAMKNAAKEYRSQKGGAAKKTKRKGKGKKKKRKILKKSY